MLPNNRNRMKKIVMLIKLWIEMQRSALQLICFTFYPAVYKLPKIRDYKRDTGLLMAISS